MLEQQECPLCRAQYTVHINKSTNGFNPCKSCKWMRDFQGKIVLQLTTRVICTFYMNGGEFHKCFYLKWLD